MSISKYDNETRERVVRLYLERRQNAPTESLTASRTHVGQLCGVKENTMRNWIGVHEVDQGARPGVPTAEEMRLRNSNARTLNYGGLTEFCT